MFYFYQHCLWSLLFIIFKKLLHPHVKTLLNRTTPTISIKLLISGAHINKTLARGDTERSSSVHVQERRDARDISVHATVPYVTKESCNNIWFRKERRSQERSENLPDWSERDEQQHQRRQSCRQIPLWERHKGKIDMKLEKWLGNCIKIW